MWANVVLPTPGGPESRITRERSSGRISLLFFSASSPSSALDLDVVLSLAVRDPPELLPSPPPLPPPKLANAVGRGGGARLPARAPAAGRRSGRGAQDGVLQRRGCSCAPRASATWLAFLIIYCDSESILISCEVLVLNLDCTFFWAPGCIKFYL